MVLEQLHRQRPKTRSLNLTSYFIKKFTMNQLFQMPHISEIICHLSLCGWLHLRWYPPAIHHKRQGCFPFKGRTAFMVHAHCLCLIHSPICKLLCAVLEGPQEFNYLFNTLISFPKVYLTETGWWLLRAEVREQRKEAGEILVEGHRISVTDKRVQGTNCIV